MKGKGSVKPNTSKSSAFKGIDEFLEKASEKPEDLQNQKIAADTDASTKALKEKYFDQFSPLALTQNMQALDKCRTQSLIIGGIAAGIFGFDGLQGMLFYLFIVALVSIVIAAKLGFSGKPYFMSLSQATTTGLFNNMLTYMLLWVMIHNFVYVL
jgi:hypothetical protein